MARADALLLELRSIDPLKREDAAKGLGELGSNLPRLDNALNDVAKNDGNPNVRRAAGEALKKIWAKPSPERARSRFGKPHAYKTTGERGIDVAAGFFGWFVGLGLFWLVFSGGLTGIMYWAVPCDGSGCGMSFAAALLFCAIPLNVVLLIALALFRHWIALGAVLGFLTNFVIASTLQLYYAPMLGVPFFWFLIST